VSTVKVSVRLCRTETFTVLTSYNAAPHNRHQLHPAEPEQYSQMQQHGLCSPEDGHNDARNKLKQKLIINI